MILRLEAASLIGSRSTLVFVILTGIVTAASAQEAPEVETQYHPDEVPTCHVASASRTRDACGQSSPTTTAIERELTLSLELAAPTVRQCETGIHSEYFQRDTIVRVEQVISNETCGASSGNFEIEALVEDQVGQTETLVFSQSWQREGDEPVEITTDYPIGENVELIRLRSRGLSCTCADAVESGD